MTSESLPRVVVLASPGQGAYRITLTGLKTGTVAKAFSAAGRPINLSLPPDTYSAFIESVSTSGTTSASFAVGDYSVDDTTDAISVGENPDRIQVNELRSVGRPTKGQHRAIQNASASTVKKADVHPETAEFLGEKAVQDARPDQGSLAFTLSLSKINPGSGHGEWQAGDFIVEFANRKTDELFVKTTDSAKVGFIQRITVSVHGYLQWRIGLPSFRDGTVIALKPAGSVDNPDLALEMRPADEHAATLIGSLQRARPDEVDELVIATAALLERESTDDSFECLTVPHALGKLIRHREEPWIAIAASLMMIRTGQISEVADIVLQFANEHSNIPDALVVGAWAIAARPEIDHERTNANCLDMLMRARRYGPPYLHTSHALALQMLAALATSSGDQAIVAASIDERGQWSTRSRRGIPVGEFFGWERRPTAEPTSASAADRPIVKGYVKRTEVRTTLALNADDSNQIKQTARYKPSVAAHLISSVAFPLICLIAAVQSAQYAFSFPLLPLFGLSFPMFSAVAPILPASMMLGCAAGAVLKALIISSRYSGLLGAGGLIVSSGATYIAAIAPTFGILTASHFLLGCASPFMLSMPIAGDFDTRGIKRATFLQMASLIGGMSGQPIAGYIAQHFGWRSVYETWSSLLLVLGGLCGVVGIIHAFISAKGYSRPLALLPERPENYRIALSTGVLSAASVIFWSAIALLLAGEPFSMGPQAVGLFGFVFVVGVGITQPSSRFEFGYAPFWLFIVPIVAAYVLFAFSERTLIGLFLGAIILEFGLFGGTIHLFRRQVRHSVGPGSLLWVASIAPNIGGAIGCWVGLSAWHLAGWKGVCTAGLLAALLAAITDRRGRTPVPVESGPKIQRN
jgi:MFS family permease